MSCWEPQASTRWSMETFLWSQRFSAHIFHGKQDKDNIYTHIMMTRFPGISLATRKRKRSYCRNVTTKKSKAPEERGSPVDFSGTRMAMMITENITIHNPTIHLNKSLGVCKAQCSIRLQLLIMNFPGHRSPSKINRDAYSSLGTRMNNRTST